MLPTVLLASYLAGWASPRVQHVQAFEFAATDSSDRVRLSTYALGANFGRWKEEMRTVDYGVLGFPTGSGTQERHPMLVSFLPVELRVTPLKGKLRSGAWWRADLFYSLDRWAVATLPGEPKANSTFDEFGLALRIPYAGVRLGRVGARTPPFHSSQNAVLLRHEHDHSGFSETRWYAALELRWDAPNN